jgi:prephenate dehydratase
MSLTKTIAIQGVRGSFHHIVTQQYFDEDIALVECMTFDAVIDSISNQKSDIAIMAIENSIAGSIIPNYALLDTHQLHIVGEHYLDIQHHLMALPNQTINDIQEVYSHPMALLQCKAFFKQYPHIKLIEDTDTAQVAQRISKNQTKHVAAIASRLAAQLFDLSIISESIQTIATNETRFFIVKNKTSQISQKSINKASIKFELDHKRGSLATVLNVLSDCGLNLSKIQSLPKIETPWKYAFFVDVTFDTYSDYDKAKSLIELMAQDFKVLGEYKNARL